MNAKAKGKIRSQLEQELKEATEQLARIEQRLEERPSFVIGEGSAGAQLWEMDLARRDRVVAQIEMLHEMLARAEDGSYGQCETCGKDIDPDRLKILPTTTLCAACALAQENH